MQKLYNTTITINFTLNGKDGSIVQTTDDCQLISEYAFTDEEKEGIKNDTDYALKMMLINISNI